MPEPLKNPITMSLPMEIPESLYQLLDVLAAANFEAYIAGGAVRDTILGKSPKDYDISTSASPKEVVERLGPYVKFAGVQGEKSFMVARLVAYDGNEYEFAPYRADEGTRKGGSARLVSSIKEDVMRRDLTINALFYKVPTREERLDGAVGQVVDYVGGIQDIEDEVIRTVGDPEERFNEDRLRILRAFRFAGRVDGQLDEATADAINKNNSLTEPSSAAVSSERIKEEIIKGVMSSKIPANYMNMLSDFGLFSQILPGLNVSRAFSSSKNIAVQLATVLQDNNPADVAKVLASKKFGNDIKNAVSFLLCLGDITEKSVVGLKKECERIKQSSSMLINDQVIMEFGMAIGKDFSKFVTFANSPPAISARELIEKGMRPGPDIGRAIRDAEVESYYKENFGEIDDISASHSVVKKMVKLSILLDRMEATVDAEALNDIIAKYANEDYFIPELSGHVYIFDMDDTLFWSPDWHNLAEFDSDNNLSHVNNLAPNKLSMGFDFIKNVNLNPESFIRESGFSSERTSDPAWTDDDERAALANEFREEIGTISLEKQLVDLPWLGKYDQLVLVAKDESGNNILPDVFKKFFANKHAKLFDLRGKYLKNAVVIAGDPEFYQAPKTLGILPNPYILDIYNKNSENAIILTARESVPGMEEGILNRILGVGASAPIHIFTKPLGEASGPYKGEVIGSIASQDAVSAVTFYDDNLKYISSVEKVLKEKYESVKDKVEIKRVDVSSKPESGLLEGDE
jgi:tRNA nucleotidyltransferase/poly(A) polymerase